MKSLTKIMIMCLVCMVLLYAPTDDAIGKDKTTIGGKGAETKDSRAWLDASRGWIESGTSFYPYSTGLNVGIGTTTPGYKLDVAGDIRITGGIHDGLGFGAANQVLVSDGLGGVAWAATPGGSGSYIWNQNAVMRAENFWMDGMGQAGDGNNVTGALHLTNVGVYGQSNDATGAGVFGDGLTASHGVYGQTNNSGYFGLYGYNAAVGGDGVFGMGNGVGSGSYWGGAGVSGSSSDLGVFGYGDATSLSWGVLGLSDATDGLGVYGYVNAATGFGMRAHNANASGTGIVGSGNNVSGIYLTDGCGGSFASSNVGTFSYGRDSADALGELAATSSAALITQPAGHDAGLCANGFQWGLFGIGQNTTDFGVGVVGLGGNTSSINYIAGSGVAGTGTGCGVLGVGTNGPGSYFYQTANYYGAQIHSAAGGAYISSDNPATYWTLVLPQTGYSSGVADGWYTWVLSDKNETHALPVSTSTEHEIHVSGTGKLVNGSASIKFPIPFNDVVSKEIPVIVTVTPTEECNGLYIAQTNTNGFVVRELNNGRSNAGFNWIAVGRQKGKESRDLTLKRLASTREIKVAKTAQRQIKKEIATTKDIKIQKIKPLKNKESELQKTIK